MSQRDRLQRDRFWRSEKAPRKSVFSIAEIGFNAFRCNDSLLSNKVQESSANSNIKAKIAKPRSADNTTRLLTNQCSRKTVMATAILSPADAPEGYRPFKCVSCGLEGMAQPSAKKRIYCNVACANRLASEKKKAESRARKQAAKATKAAIPPPHSKTCTKCGEVKSISEFSKDSRNGHKASCKTCRNKETASWASENKPRLNAARVERRATDQLWKLSDRVRKMTAQAFAKRGYPKSGKTAEIIGCDWDFLFRHIERQFLPGMTWGKVGREIHIDHIAPISTAASPEEVIKLSHFTNLRPLWASDNMKKGARREFLL